MSYQGWTNYETWVVALWIDNEEGSYRMAREAAGSAYREALPRHGLTQLEAACNDLARTMKEEHEEAAPQLNGVFDDLLGRAMSAVDWHEIAKHLIDEVVAEGREGGDAND